MEGAGPGQRTQHPLPLKTATAGPFRMKKPT